MISLFVLKTSQFPSGLCLEEVALLVRLDGEHPSSCHTVLPFDLPQVNEIKNLVVNPGFALKVFAQQTVCCILVLRELRLLFVHEISSWPLILLLFHRWPYSTPACLWFGIRRLLGVQFVC